MLFRSKTCEPTRTHQPAAACDDERVILRCTGKVLGLLGVRATSLPALPPDPDDWYVNLLWMDRRKCLLLVHAATLFPVFVPDVRKSDLAPLDARVTGWIVRELAAEGLRTDALGAIDQASVSLTTTASRVTLGYMNQTGQMLRYLIARDGGVARCDVVALNRFLRRELHLSRALPGYVIPIDEARRRAGASGGASGQTAPVHQTPGVSNLLYLPGTSTLSNQKATKVLISEYRAEAPNKY